MTGVADPTELIGVVRRHEVPFGTIERHEVRPRVIRPVGLDRWAPSRGLVAR